MRNIDPIPGNKNAIRILDLNRTIWHSRTVGIFHSLPSGPQFFAAKAIIGLPHLYEKVSTARVFTWPSNS